ncbi:MAG: leucine-rich repeat protein [Ruminococcus sp.]|nr:leucine-rich repeat protein [Ruminococcus sp.]
MKKIISIILTLSLIMTCCMLAGMTVSAAESDFTYSATSATTAEITGYKGTSANVSVPSTIGGLTVMGIGKQAFYQNKTIEKVTIPSGVTYIGDKAFAGSYIKTVSIPDTVMVMGNSAFSYCIYLTDVTLSKGAKTISNNCFSNCTRLESIVIPEGVTTIATGAFENCTHLAEITLPSTLKTIETYGFAYTDFTELILPEGLETIGSFAFFLCPKLKAVTFPSTLKTIDDWAFCSCSALKNLNFSIKGSLETIGDNAFDSCPLGITILPASVTSIGDYAMGYYYSNETFDYVKYGSFSVVCTEGSAALDYAANNNFPYNIYTVDTPTEPNTSEPVTSEPTTSEPEAKYELGDVNLDGKVNIKDATAIQKHLASLESLSEEGLAVADYDADNRLSVKDATAIQKVLAGIV